MCVRVHVCENVYVCVYVFMCVCDRERARALARDRETERICLLICASASVLPMRPKPARLLVTSAVSFP